MENETGYMIYIPFYSREAAEKMSREIQQEFGLFSTVFKETPEMHKMYELGE